MSKDIAAMFWIVLFLPEVISQTPTPVVTSKLFLSKTFPLTKADGSVHISNIVARVKLLETTLFKLRKDVEICNADKKSLRTEMLDHIMGMQILKSSLLARFAAFERKVQFQKTFTEGVGKSAREAKNVTLLERKLEQKEKNELNQAETTTVANSKTEFTSPSTEKLKTIVASRNCSADEFRCGDDTCIDSLQVCDAYPDCSDRSDEDANRCTCGEDDFTCGDGRCIPSTRKCDHRHDCTDGSDEENCAKATCGFDDWTCNNGDCVADAVVCNRKYDCRDGSDEFECSDRTCRSDQFRCNSGQCISSFLRCNQNDDCADRSDEQGCDLTQTCPPDTFMCANSECLPLIWRCDGDNDCEDLSDETNCQ